MVKLASLENTSFAIRAISSSKKAPPRLVLLPGLDGTGKLFENFLAVAPLGVSVQVLSLNNERLLSWEQECDRLAKALGSEPAVLLAESFSGRFAFALSQRESTTIHHVVFAATFLKNPHWFTQVAVGLPCKLFDVSWIPDWVLRKVLFNSKHSESLIPPFRRALAGVPFEILKNRLQQIAKMEAPCSPLLLPCTYLRATQDVCVPHRSLAPFRMLCPNLVVKEIKSGHLLLQTNPKWVWQILLDYVFMDLE